MPLWGMLFVILFVLLVLRVPIAISLGTAALICLASIQVPLSVIAQRIFVSLDSFSIMAIPFFILAGNLMSAGGISRRLCAFTSALLMRIRGGLASAAVLACGFFGALSGSGPATVISVGSMIYPDMVERGYPKEEMAGLLSVAGGLGPLIPPSIIMVVYGTLTNTSIGDMFIAGAGIGVVTMLALMAVVAVRARKGNWTGAVKRTNWRLVGKTLLQAVLALGMPVIILGGIYGGVFTPTEAACVAVVYSFFIGMFVYKNITWKDLPTLLKDSAVGSAVVLFIMATSAVFAWLFAYAGFTEQIVNAVLSFGLSKYALLFILSIVLLLFGCFMEGIAIVTLLMPIVLPLATAVEVAPIHLGMIVCLSVIVGCMTPPVAVNIFAAGTVSRLKLEQIVKGELPYFVTMLVIYFAVVFVDGFSLFLLG